MTSSTCWPGSTEPWRASPSPAIAPQRTEQAFALVTVVPELRRRGTGAALYEAVSAWARERSLGVIETIVADNDPESLAFAKRRGLAGPVHELGVWLDLGQTEPRLPSRRRASR